MKAFPVILAVLFLVLAFSAGAATADTPESEVQVLPSPSITLNITNGTFYNLTFAGMALETHNVMYRTGFFENHWTFTKVNDTSYFYKSNVRLNQVAGEGMSPDVNPASNEQGSQMGTLNAEVKITLNALNYSLSNLGIENNSIVNGNFSFPDYSVMEITISVVFQQAVQGPGALYLYQLIKSSNESNNAVKYFLGNVTHNLRDRLQGDHEGMQIIPSAKERLGAFYWWNNSFQLNGVNKNLTSNVGLRDGGIFIAFKFPFENSLKSIYEDPYFGIPGTPLFKNPIIKKDFGQLINYVVIHAEYLGTGVATGVGLLGISYSIYRRRRF